MKENVTLKRGCIIAIAVYILAMLIYWFCGYDSLFYRDSSTDMVQNELVVGEITSDSPISQNIIPEDDCELRSITLLTATYNRNNTSHLNVEVKYGSTVISEASLDASNVTNNGNTVIEFENPAKLKQGKMYTVVISSDAEDGNGVTIYAGTKYAAGKAAVSVNLSEAMQAKKNAVPLGCSLCWELNTRTHLIYGMVFPFVVLAGGALLTAYCFFMIHREKSGKTCWGLKIITAFKKYRYLIKQLVVRDFKTKYKRSVLGVLWSFLNPILMMTVQYVVFSTLFSSTIKNFSLYLLIGIICFNFFSECTGMCLNSIIANAPLITKVYMPKYIYPVSRALSSSINLLFSLIPLIGVMIITQAPFSKSLLLVPIPLLCLFAFSLGIGMILATMMVFFRDTQFLWGVLSTVWMYITPIIYPESILPQDYILLFKLNPLYHIVKVIRTILIDGASPDPLEYIVMIAMSGFMLIIGAVIFKKEQDKFVLNI